MFGTDFSDRQKDYNSGQTMFSLTELTIDTVKKFQIPSSKIQLTTTKPTYCPTDSYSLYLDPYTLIPKCPRLLASRLSHTSRVKSQCPLFQSVCH